jgi:hypothetical protein
MIWKFTLSLLLWVGTSAQSEGPLTQPAVDGSLDLSD